MAGIPRPCSQAIIFRPCRKGIPVPPSPHGPAYSVGKALLCPASPSSSSLCPSSHQGRVTQLSLRNLALSARLKQSPDCRNPSSSHNPPFCSQGILMPGIPMPPSVHAPLPPVVRASPCPAFRALLRRRSSQQVSERSLIHKPHYQMSIQ
jgi:hypothetical protein